MLDGIFKIYIPKHINTIKCIKNINKTIGTNPRPFLIIKQQERNMEHYFFF